MRGSVGIALVLLVAVAVGGCAADSAQTPSDLTPRVPQQIVVTSSAFDDGASLPARFTCQGAGVSPPLAWTGVPSAATSLALLVEDPDAPNGTYWHWVVLDLPPATTSLPEGGPLPDGAVEGANSAQTREYAAPCPPSGEHRYRFTVFALSAPTGLPPGAPIGSVERELAAKTIARGSVVATVTA